MENQTDPKKVLTEMIADLDGRIETLRDYLDRVDANDTRKQIEIMQELTKLTAELGTLLKFKRCMGW